MRQFRKPGPDLRVENLGKGRLSGKHLGNFEFGDNTAEAVIKGTNGAVKTEDGLEIPLAEAMKDNGGGGLNRLPMFLARMVQEITRFQPPRPLKGLANNTKELKRDTNSISGDLTEAGAKDRLTLLFDAAMAVPTVTDPKAQQVKFWTKDSRSW